MKPKYIIYPLLILVIGYILYNKFYGAGAKEKKIQPATKGGKKPNKPVPVNVMLVKDTAFSNAIDITGTIDANEQVDLRSETAGNITGIYFKEGTHVSKGQLLVKVYNQDQYASLKSVQVQTKLAEIVEYRNRILLQKEAVSKEEYDTSLSSLNVLKSQADLIRAQIARTEVRAPFSGIIGLRKFSGIIGLRNISPGGYLSPTSSIATLVNMDPAKITFSVPERYLGLIKTGSKIRFNLESTRENFTGTVYAIEPNLNLTSRSVTIRAKSPNPKGLMRAGSFAKINLTLEQVPKTIMVPTECVIPDIKTSKVFVVSKGVAESRDVKTDVRTATKIQIVDGLKPGDSLIVSGIIQLRPKVALKIVKIIK
ncbi:MAG: efflux RND transporter periplasmic adaptor subunit [Sphingobacteriaceae bacterium]|nr:MAG: efflux RND transporter periplasmic adaptor subunit [Sphingobacteriaceae bacterium]